MTLASILITPNWSQLFELMCDASDVAVGAMLSQMKDKVIYRIYYVSKTFNEVQENYTTTKKELLAIVFVIENIRSYIVGSKVTVHSDQISYVEERCQTTINYVDIIAKGV